jgi:hypothetical protein
MTFAGAAPLLSRRPVANSSARRSATFSGGRGSSDESGRHGPAERTALVQAPLANWESDCETTISICQPAVGGCEQAKSPSFPIVHSFEHGSGNRARRSASVKSPRGGAGRHPARLCRSAGADERSTRRLRARACGDL